MMREIKFKAKRIVDDKWYFGFLSGLNGDICFIRVGSWSLNCDSETLGQYTGLKDKNGVEIYEGDIVNITYCDGERDDIVETREVIWSNNESGYSPLNWEYLCEGCDCCVSIMSIEVIGNIYENKELLEEKE